MIKPKSKLKEIDEVEQNYRENWKEIIEKDGVVDLEQVKKELWDYSFLLENVPYVYSEIAGLSKPNYHAHVILERHEERFLSKRITQDDVMDMIKGCSDLEELKECLVEYFEIELEAVKDGE